MENSVHDFHSLLDEEEKKSVKDRVLKRVKVNPAKKKVISYDSREEKEERVEPIMENGQIIGVRYFCKCGNVANIFFEFQE
ncbi:MAG: hypothetical protein DRP91_01985 [Candidatus Neomarinimicrobiota bacterium]|nr:MAG: hypothetical protein DRP91_01985 [Candidatus Neomarinimicrobiota bacterium]